MVLLQHAGRQGDDGHARAPRGLLLRPDGARGGQAIDLGHLQVHEHQVEGAAGAQLHGLPAAVRGGDLVGAARQRQLQQLQVGGHIVHRQDAQGRQLLRGGQFQGLRRLARRQGQAHGKLRALPGRALHADAPLHQLHELARNGRTQARAAEAARGRGVGLGEGVEDALQLLRIHADAGVLHVQVQLARAVAHAQQDLATLGELDGVAQQVDQHLLHAQRVAAQELGFGLGVVEHQGQALAAGADAQRIEDLPAQRAQREVLHLQRDGALVELGGVQDVVEQAQQRARRGVHRAELAALRRVQGRVEQGFGVAQDGIHGRADLVAHVGQEAGARGGGGFGALLGGAQVLLHGAALG